MVEVDDLAATTHVKSELERFLVAKMTHGEGDANNPLLWWKIHERDFPTVAKIAWDFLAIPGTSVSSRHFCAELRSSLKAKTIMQALLTKVWIKAGLLKI
ncbi:hypothetical protein Hypma_005716 [Hypsizygus marmoreus]|uniref:HAT C-terminal dimerisation domain-containing protein n=1 Tax=Hypsizygus marmoreus TaxID=39966 RepID=A0A369K7T7_HYPMA|nr:hypothetical protein Hypma_005716 [Hypsizygus marmoreus]